MSAELFFIYDTHCPWSYVSLPLVNEIAQAFPDINLHLWHSARYEGDENIAKQTIESVSVESNLDFNKAYLDNLTLAKDSTMAANVFSWAQHKIPHLALPLLNRLFKAHFEQGNELLTLDDLAEIIEEFKLSPPKKVFTRDKFTREAEIVIHDIDELQEVIGTQAIPALLLAVEDDLILLNHNLYLKSPKSIVDAIKLELK